MIILLPALLTPFFLDDYLHASMVHGTFPAKRSVFDLYDFVDDGDRAALWARGLLPWWSHPALTIRFFRPLSSLLLWVDHDVFGAHPLPMHLHSLAWWLFAVLAVRALYRPLAPRARVLATFVYALAPCHALPLAWVANREALVSLAFGSLGLAAYARFRRAGAGGARGARDLALAAVLFALALAGGGEYALAFGGYVVAFDLGVLGGGRARFVGGARRAVIGWLSFAAPAAGYLALRGALRYGTFGSGFYSDPVRSPASFLAKAPHRAAVLLGDAWLSIDTVTWTTPAQKIAGAALVVTGLVVVAWLVRGALGALEGEARARVAWLVGGSVVSIVPVLAVVPSMRLLGVAMIGVAPAVAIVLDRAWFHGEATPATPAKALASLAAIGLGFAQLVHGPGTTFLASRQLRADAKDFAWRTGALAEPAARVGEIGVVRGLAGMFFAPFAIDPSREPPRWMLLAHTGHVLAVRHDARSLELRVPKDKSIYPAGDGNLFRGEESPLLAGDEVVFPGFRASILETGASGPTRVRFVFDRDPDAVPWFSDGYDALKAVDLPRPGFGAPFDP